MPAEVVLNQNEYCTFLKSLPLWSGGTAYRAALPWNCLYLDPNTNVLWADCNNLVKATIWGRATIPEPGNNWYAPGRYGLNDLTCAQLINSCDDISTDFNNIIPGECMFMPGINGDPDHIGTYVGNFIINGVTCNVIEATAGFESGILATYVSNTGQRTNGQGGTPGGTWQKHGKLPWIAYDIMTDDELLWYAIFKRIQRYF